MNAMSFISPDFLLWMFVLFFVLFIVMLILSLIMVKKNRELKYGDIIKKILKERKLSLKFSKVAGIKYVVFTGGNEKIKRRPGNIIGKYKGSIEWEYITEILVSKWGKSYYLVVPNEYLTDPNRKIYPIRARAVSYHTFAFVPVVGNAKEQERVFDFADEWLDMLINKSRRHWNKEEKFRQSMQASDISTARLPAYIVKREEEVEENE